MAEKLEARGELENVRWGVASRQTGTPWWSAPGMGAARGRSCSHRNAGYAQGAAALDWTEVQCA